ncbi:MAG: 5'-deoxyadenosine deaminase [Clostridia bacterium]|nr:5'-deoxyadenosine deaminase [Clostridia bacterium]
MSAILIKDATIVTMDPERRVIEHGDILVEADRIREVGVGIAADVDRVIHASGRIVMPGLIQTHVHLCQALFRGMSDDMELMDWLRRRTWPLEASHDDDSIYFSAMLGIAELLRGGTTSVVDMETVHHTDSAFHAIEQCGIRAISGKVMMDWGEDVPKGLMETREQSISESVALAERWDGASDGRIHYAFTPRFAVSCTDRLLREVSEIAREFGSYIHTHSSESLGEIEIVKRERGARNVIYLDQVGLLGPRTILAHCVHLDQSELETLARTSTHVVHCPSVNMKLASGIAPIPEMLAMGINVSLGADGAGGNNNLDQFVEMRHAALIHKPRLGPTAMPAMAVLEMATVRGAAAMGMSDSLGSIERGKKADLIIVDLRKPHASPGACANPVSRIVYSAHSSDVVMTMVDGRILYEEGRLTTIDEAQTLASCDDAIVRVARRAGVVA